MAIQFRTVKSSAGAGVSVGEPVVVEGCEGQYVVVRVDSARERVELVS